MNCTSFWRSSSRVAVLLAAVAWAVNTLGNPAPTAAEEAIPFAALTPTNAVLARAVTDHYTLRRSYSAREFLGEPAVLEWFLDNLDATWKLARALQLPARVTRKDEEGRIWSESNPGEKGFFLPIHQQPGLRLYFMEGTQQKFCTLTGRGIIVINYEGPRSGVLRVTGKQFIKVEGTMLSALTQIFGPFLRSSVDRAYRELLEPLTALCELAARHPDRLRAAVASLPAAEAASLAGLLEILPAPAKP